MRHSLWWSPVVSRSVGAACLVFLCGCGLGTGSADEIEVAAPLPDMLVRADLQRLVDAGLDRRAGPLIEALFDPDASVRATAAYALASVQDPAARPALTALLEDPEPRVRREAAFALGQLGEPRDGSALVAALRSEADPAVRLVLMEAAGKGGDGAALAELLGAARIDASAEERLGLALALYHFGRRGATHHDAGRVLLELVAGKNARHAVTAALALAAPRDPGDWGAGLDEVRRALEVMPRDRPAAGPLLGIVARHADPGDLPLLRRWLAEAAVWNVRVAAAKALGAHPAARRSAEAVGALVAALDDPSPHVATTAAGALVGVRWERSPGAAGAGDLVDPEVLAGWIRAHPERPAVAAALLPGLVGTAQQGLVLDWARGALGRRARPVLAWPSLARIDSPVADSLLVAGLRGGRRDAYVAAAALADRVAALPANAPLRNALIPLVTRRMELWGPHAPSSDARGLTRLVRELADSRPDGAGRLLEAAASHPHPAVRGVAERFGVTARPPAAPPRRTVDWRLLAEAGAKPRLEFRTAKGTFVVELYPEIAPLAVSSLLSRAAAGEFDRLAFHRVEADFILQSGDFQNPLGYGGPTRGLRSEFTRLRYAPGVLGLASAGKDTEGSQYFITHGYQPSLDGRYGAVGRVVSGWDVAEAVALGDSIVSVTPAGRNDRAAYQGR